MVDLVFLATEAHLDRLAHPEWYAVFDKSYATYSKPNKLSVFLSLGNVELLGTVDQQDHRVRIQRTNSHKSFCK